MRDPFETLSVDKDLACKFFGFFARFEYAMKATSYCNVKDGFAEPNWNKLINDLGKKVEKCGDAAVGQAITYMIEQPPKKQKCCESGGLVFEPAGFGWNAPGCVSLDCARRVRNNLFHGGKSGLAGNKKRDETLILSSLKLLECCLALESDLAAVFNE